MWTRQITKAIVKQTTSNSFRHEMAPQTSGAATAASPSTTAGIPQTSTSLLPAITGVADQLEDRQNISTSNNLNSHGNSARLQHGPASSNSNHLLYSRTPALEPPPRSTTPPPTLLRDWQQQQQQQASPPVAPAVVVASVEGEENVEHGTRRTTSSGYSYPVATFVRDLVRNGMDQISTYQRHSSTSNDETTPLSVRSEADAEALAAAMRSTNTLGAAVSARTMQDYMDQDQEYILVDGDLIPVAPEPTEEQEMMEDRLQQEQLRKTCQTATNPRRMRKGVRKISKFFRRVRRSSHKDHSSDRHSINENPSMTASLPTSDRSSREELMDRQQDDVPVTNIPRKPPPSSSPRRLGLRRRRGSWKKQDQQQSTQSIASEQSFERPYSREGSEELDVVQQMSQTALTGLEPTAVPPAATASSDLRVPPQNPDYAAVQPTVQPQAQHPLLHHHHSDPLSPPAMPFMEPIQESEHSSHRTASVTAVFVGTNDQIHQPGFDAGLLPADVAAIAFIEDSEDMSYYKKDDGVIVPSVLPPDADYKVDKSDAPDVESMLMRAAHETTNDLDSSDMPAPSLRGIRGKSGSGDSIPLSHAQYSDVFESQRSVFNDTLKVVMAGAPGVDKSWVARSLRGSHKRPRKRATLGVDVHSWIPSIVADGDGSELSEKQQQIKCVIWDVQGATGTPDDIANFGAHPGTQSLFFSEQALYLLVWDLACHNADTNLKTHALQDSDSEEEEDDEEDDAFVREQANRWADRALLADISRRVLPWVDTIVLRGPNSAILPVAIVPDAMSEAEVNRRYEIMQNALIEHVNRYEGQVGAPKLLSSAESTILCVDHKTGEGMRRLQETVQAIATDTSRSVFDHVGTDVPYGTVKVLDLVRGYKEQHKLILLDHLMGELDNEMSVSDTQRVLQFLSSIGEILYFGAADDDILSRYIVLSRKWLVSALSCILRNDLRRELVETRRFMNMQCIYSEQKFTENEVINVLAGGTMSSCPLLSDTDTMMLWQSMSFMREAADHYSQLSETSTSTPTMFYFLERLLVHTGIFIPLEIPDQPTLDRSEVFFVPSLLAQADPGAIWTYKTGESYKATLCHSWLFRNGVPPNLMEHLTVKVLGALYAFSRKFLGQIPHAELPSRSHTVPVRGSSLDEILQEHDKHAIGRIKIHEIVCWNSSLLVKIGTIFADQSSGELRESFVEAIVTVADQSANHCVASDAMRAGSQRVIVSGKGQVGHHGRKIWKGGYDVILSAVRECLADLSNVDSQVVCPECLAHSSARSASTWSWDSIYALAEGGGGSVVRCMRGHRVDSNFVCGTIADRKQAPEDLGNHVRSTKPVTEILPSVVVVGLWDPRSKSIQRVGSGFVVDRKIGLVATAGHVLFNMERGSSFGLQYYGIPGARVVIGVIPGNGHVAKFRYFGEIVAEDIHAVDGCIVSITSRMEEDVDDPGAGCAEQPEYVLSAESIGTENLRSLKLTNRLELEEPVRIVGYNQGGNGVFEKGMHVNRSADFSTGCVCSRFQGPGADDSSSEDSSSHTAFAPREEIIVTNCPTISGHSGGPCVNDEGKVIGLLSRADSVDHQRCYLVPASELKILLNEARKKCSRKTALKSLPSA